MPINDVPNNYDQDSSYHDVLWGDEFLHDNDDDDWYGDDVLYGDNVEHDNDVQHESPFFNGRHGDSPPNITLEVDGGHT